MTSASCGLEGTRTVTMAGSAVAVGLLPSVLATTEVEASPMTTEITGGASTAPTGAGSRMSSRPPDAVQVEVTASAVASVVDVVLPMVRVASGAPLNSAVEQVAEGVLQAEVAGVVDRLEDGGQSAQELIDPTLGLVDDGGEGGGEQRVDRVELHGSDPGGGIRRGSAAADLGLAGAAGELDDQAGDLVEVALAVLVRRSGGLAVSGRRGFGVPDGGEGVGDAVAGRGGLRRGRDVGVGLAGGEPLAEQRQGERLSVCAGLVGDLLGVRASVSRGGRPMLRRAP